MLFPNLKELIRLKSILGSTEILRDRTNNRMQGDYSSLFHGLGVEFETVRPYVIGDDVRYIDWRVTARIGKPQVKTFRAECDRNVLVVVDANAYMRFGTRVTFKSVQAAKAAALFCWQSLQQQDRVGGLIFGDIANGMQYFKPDKTKNSVLRMLKLLCNEQVDQHAMVSLPSALIHLAQVATPQSLVFVLSDFSMANMNELEKALLALRKKCTLVLLPVHDPADKDIPAVGSLMFADNGTGVEINTDNAQARKNYQQAWQDYSEKLIHTSKKLKAPLLWIETAVDPVRALYSRKGTVHPWKT